MIHLEKLINELGSEASANNRGLRAGGVRGHTTRAPTKADYNNSNDNAHRNNIPFELIKTHSTTITHHFGTNRQLEAN